MTTVKLFFSFLLIFSLSVRTTVAATINLSIQLYDTSGSPAGGGTLIPPSAPNVWDLIPNQQFRVRVFGQVTDPYFTDTNRAGTAFDNQPLGIELIAGQLISSGVGVVVPLVNGSGTWLNFNRRAGVQFNTPTFVNVLDVDSDGDLDVAGAGVATTKLSLDDPEDDPAIDGPELAHAQVGALGVPQELFQGWYQATGFGSTELIYFIDKTYGRMVFKEGINEPTGLEVLPVGFLTTPITINVIPEPTYYFALSSALFVFLKLRRKRLPATHNKLAS